MGVPRLLASIGGLLALLCLAGPAPAASRLPDLRVGKLKSKLVAEDGAVALTYAIRNSGQATAKGSRMRVWVVAKKRSTRGSLVGSVRVKRVRAGRSSRSTKLTIAASRLAGETGYLRACADALKRVKERAERNNCRVAALPAGAGTPAPTTDWVDPLGSAPDPSPFPAPAASARAGQRWSRRRVH